MSKKLSNVEINVLSNEISKKINEVKYEKIKSKLEKDVDFKKLEKLNVEIKKLSDSINEKRKLYNDISLKIKSKFNINNVYLDNNNEVKVVFNYNNYYNDLVLFNINKDLNVDDLINRVVEKYS
jgi:vacuolar-type H+-ATPase subunit I/STV1